MINIRGVALFLLGSLVTSLGSEMINEEKNRAEIKKAVDEYMEEHKETDNDE